MTFLKTLKNISKNLFYLNRNLAMKEREKNKIISSPAKENY